MDSFERLLRAQAEASTGDEDDLTVLDIVLEDDGIRTSSSEPLGGPSKIVALRDQIDRQVQGCGDPDALRAVIHDLTQGVLSVFPDFEQMAEQYPEHADRCRRSIAAYTDLHEALQHMLAWFDDQSRNEILTQGLAWVEGAVVEIDALVAEFQ